LDSLDSGETLRNEKNLAKDSMAETIKVLWYCALTNGCLWQILEAS
jgi:hypothetical protein